MAGRVTRSVATLLASINAPMRVTRAQLQSVYNDRTNPVRVTRVQVQSVYNDRTNPVRVTRIMVQQLASIKEKPRPIHIAPINNDKPVLIQREYNPYRPTLPREIESVDSTLHDFMSEHTEIQREQHNKTQAGDSTFPWELLTKIGPEKQFTLGSNGRFFHDDYGLIQARYCQFSKMKPGNWVNGPVGTFKSADSVDWIVTNDFDLSSPDLVVGVLGSYDIPKDGDYGWVLTHGANHVQVRVDPKVTVAANDPLMWSGFETVAPTGKGKIVGRALAPSLRVDHLANRVNAGAVMLNPEGPSPDSLSATIVKPIADKLDDVQKSLDKANVTELADQVKKAGAAVDLVQKRVIELGKAGTKVSDLDKRVTAVEKKQPADQSAAIAALTKSDTAQTKRITALESREIVPVGLEQRLDNLEAFAQKPVPKPTRLIPLVDGAIPPNLVYTPDGNLVFVEIPA